MSAAAPPRPLRLGLIGLPVAHSRSPLLHETAARLAGLTLTYPLLPTAEEALDDRLARLAEAGHRGVNATAPLKVALVARARTLGPEAARVGAVNTVCFGPDGAGFVGHNTDLAGALACLPEDPPADAPALVLGAGGAARAVLVALAERWPGPIRLAARRPEVARAVAAELGVTLDRVLRLDEAPATLSQAALVVNVLPDPARPLLDAWPWRLPKPLHFLDLGYAPAARATVARLAAAGHRAEDGLRLLAAQGVAAFAHFTGRTVPLAPVLAALRAAADGPPVAGTAQGD